MTDKLKELKQFALDANTQRRAMYMGLDDSWITAEELLQDGIQKEITACFIAAASPDVVLALIKRAEDAEAEVARYRTLVFTDNSETVVNAQRKLDSMDDKVYRLNRQNYELSNERDQLQAKVERLTKYNDQLIEEGANNLGLAKERNELQARVNAMEGREPVAYRWWHTQTEAWSFGDDDFLVGDPECQPLYLASGAAPHTEQANKALRDAADRSYAVAKAAQAAPKCQTCGFTNGHANACPHKETDRDTN